MASRPDADSFDNTTMEMLSANLPSNAFATSTPDPRLERARQETERTNQITPLLKEELRWRILSKRLEKGEPEIEINPAEPKSYELTEEEKAKRERRKAQNRRAAKKCREKRKMKTLSEAEKYRFVRDENQQLRNDVTYLKHKESVFRKFCVEHILHGQCSTGPSDESLRRRLLSLLESNMKSEYPTLHQGQVAATPLRSCTHQSQAEASSSSVFHHSFFQNRDRDTGSTVAMSGTAAQAVYQAEQSVTTIQELAELPVHEISSLLPTESDFSVSDHSLESTPADLSPTSLFNTLSPTSSAVASSGGAVHSFFSQLTASTSFSSNNTSLFSTSSDDILLASHSGSNNTSSFSTSSDEILLPSHSGSSILMNSPFPNLISSNCQKSPDISVSYLQGIANCNREISRKVCAASNFGEVSSNSVLDCQTGKQFRGRYSADPNLNSAVSPDSVRQHEDGGNLSLRAGVHNVIINNAFFSEFPSNLECLISNYLSTEQMDGLESNVSEGEPLAHTVPDLPLSPESLASPHVSLSPRSPCCVSLDTRHKDCSSAQFQPSAAGVPQSYNSATPNPATQGRHVVRRASSTTSVPSPYFNHQMSITLSPPPSVPSPTSNGVPESPSILPHFSPVSSTAADDCSPARFYDASKEGLN
ncbi:hypothetical protein BsWGS_15497 [Bradybaena similaris]